MKNPNLQTAIAVNARPVNIKRRVSVWYGVIVPRGRRPAIVARLERKFLHATKLPEVRERLSSLGLEVTPMASTDFGQYLKRETQNWGDLVRVSGATPE